MTFLCSVLVLKKGTKPPDVVCNCLRFCKLGSRSHELHVRWLEVNGTVCFANLAEQTRAS